MAQPALGPTLQDRAGVMWPPVIYKTRFPSYLEFANGSKLDF